MSDRPRQLRVTALVLALAVMAGGLVLGLALAFQSARSLATPAAAVAAPARRLETALWAMVATADRYADGDAAVGRDAVDQHLDQLSRALTDAERSLAAARQGWTDTTGPVRRLQRALGEFETDLQALAPGQSAEYAPVRAALVEIAPAMDELARTAERSEAADAAARAGGLQDRLVLIAWLIGLGGLSGAAAIGLLAAETGAVRRRGAAAQEGSVEAGGRFRAIAEALPTAILLVDRASGAIRYENPAATDLLGPPAQGSAMARLAAVFVDLAGLEATLDERAPVRTDRREVRLRRRDGIAFPAAISVRPIEDGGAPCSLIELADLTDLSAVRAEDEQRREIRHQRDKLDALAALLAGVAHELNNPLSVVVAQATMLEEISADERIVARGQKIRAAAERCARIVRSFLTTARQRPPTPAELDLDGLVDTTLESLSPGLAGAGIALARERQAGPLRIAADPEQIRQLLSQLVLNAEQAMSDWTGARRLTVSTRLDAGGGMAELSVADSGPGVAAAIKPRIFEPFFTTKPLGSGTGIGLSVCYGITNAHGGSIAVEDAAGGGARFVVRLPAIAARPAPEPPPAPAGRRLLIVDDEPDVRETLAEILARDGYQIDIADGGQAALEQLGRRRYDAVVSDVRMPDIDGVALYRRIRGLGTGLERRFIVVTGDTLSPSIRAFLEEARLPCIDKPFVPAEVRRLVAAVVGGGAAPAPPQVS
jgi:PAS domain S-box-containing protein